MTQDEINRMANRIRNVLVNKHLDSLKNMPEKYKFGKPAKGSKISQVLKGAFTKNKVFYFHVKDDEDGYIFYKKLYGPNYTIKISMEEAKYGKKTTPYIITITALDGTQVLELSRPYTVKPHPTLTKYITYDIDPTRGFNLNLFKTGPWVEQVFKDLEEIYWDIDEAAGESVIKDLRDRYGPLTEG